MKRWLWVALLLHVALLMPWLTWPDNDSTSAPVVHTQLNVQPPSESMRSKYASTPVLTPASISEPTPMATNAERSMGTPDTAEAVVHSASSADKRLLSASGSAHQQHTSHQAKNHQSKSLQSKTSSVRRTSPPKPKTERSTRTSTSAQSQLTSTLVLSGRANNRYEQRLLDHLKASVPVLKGVSGQVHIEMTISYGQIITQIRVLSVRVAPNSSLNPNADAMIRRWVVPAVLKANPLPPKPSDYDEPYRFRPVLVLP